MLRLFILAVLFCNLGLASIICENCTNTCNNSSLLPVTIAGNPRETFCRQHTGSCQACVDNMQLPKTSSCLMEESLCLYVDSPSAVPDCARCETNCLMDSRVPDTIIPPSNPTHVIPKASYCHLTANQCQDCTTLPAGDKERFNCNRVIATCLYVAHGPT